MAMIAVAGAVAAHHSIPADMHDMPAGVTCVAVLGAGIAVATAIGLLALRRTWAAPDEWRPTWTWIGAPRSAPVRAGPLIFLRLQILRR
ncbi:MAG: hypothetical protein JWO74_1131 [Solirubrobacterales bacterium]|jgi:hypothetical protein|nr:hypothetical protein [Solirubrobacterales bacterium]